MNTSTPSSAIRVKEIAYVGYPVTDLARARNFYENILNLKVSMNLEEGGKGWVEYDIGSGTLSINNSAAEQWAPSKDGPAVALEVEDFDASVQSLRDAGVVFYLEPLATGMCRLAVFGDPDGNSIAIHQRNAQ